MSRANSRQKIKVRAKVEMEARLSSNHNFTRQNLGEAS